MQIAKDRIPKQGDIVWLSLIGQELPLLQLPVRAKVQFVAWPKDWEIWCHCKPIALHPSVTAEQLDQTFRAIKQGKLQWRKFATAGDWLSSWTSIWSPWAIDVPAELTGQTWSAWLQKAQRHHNEQQAWLTSQAQMQARLFQRQPS